MVSEKSLKNLKPCKNKEEAQQRGRKGGKVTGRKKIIQKTIKELWKDMAFMTLEEMQSKYAKNNAGNITTIEYAMYNLYSMCSGQINEETKRKAIVDVLRLSGLEPPTQIQQQTIGVKKVFIKKDDKIKATKFINDFIGSKCGDDV